jgi:hypothetical protein
MKTADGFQQTCNAQAALEIESRLVVGPTVTDAPNDKEQLAPTLGAPSPVVKSIGAVLIDSGFYSAAAAAPAFAKSRRQARAEDLRGHRPAATRAQRRATRTTCRSTRPRSRRRRQGHHGASTGDARLGENFARSANKPSSPCSGSSKRRWDSGACCLRALAKVRAEWTRVTLACNLRRLFHAGADLAAAQTPSRSLIGSRPSPPPEAGGLQMCIRAVCGARFSVRSVSTPLAHHASPTG